MVKIAQDARNSKEMEKLNNDTQVNIDERSHQRIPTVTERMLHATVSVFLAFVLFQIIGFWVFPGLGWYGLGIFKGFLGFGPAIEVVDVVGVSLMAISGVLGWFRGKYVIDRLVGYLDFWKFW